MASTPHLSVLRTRAAIRHLDALTHRVRTPHGFEYVSGTQRDGRNTRTLVFDQPDGTEKVYEDGQWLSCTGLPAPSTDPGEHLSRMWMLGLLDAEFMLKPGLWFMAQPEHYMSHTEYADALSAALDDAAAYERGQNVDA